ncbi:Dabb family protein [Solimicrobium silvestre]|uniref:Stress responsive A/B Barrel Domain n=1 Tax=Solimicrobium silvestre TaxID=2099400 RepID=A0A2S9GU72_9BURK|nr:Dabb family protein [Solimicrobium silvestre]PRC91285.1 Stress responsive A/B Barrel Domain [Solimicrobium silvestre]
MIKHIVMWKLKEHAECASKATNAIKIKEQLATCANLVPGMLTLEVAIASPELEATYDVLLYTEFTDKAALDAYQEHPTHQAIKPFIGSVRLERQCMDYEV